MKKIVFIIIANLIAATAFSQFIYKIKADSVLITNDSCNAELNLENSTKNVLGFLYNKGNGRTQFRKGLVFIDSNTYIIGADTLKIPPGLSNLYAKNGLTRVGDSIKLGGDLQSTTNINLKDNRFKFFLTDPAYTTGLNGGVTITGARTDANGNDYLYIQAFNRPTSSASGSSIFAETFWQPAGTITGGAYNNYTSVHKSDNSNINMSGSDLRGFRSLFRVNQSNQIFGNWYHFYGGISPAVTLGGLTNHYGLYLESLKLPNTVSTYAIYTNGIDDSIYNAGPVRWPKYKNNAAGDSVLTTDINGNIKLKLASGSTSNAWNLIGNSTTNSGTNFLGTTDNVSLRIRTNNTPRAVIDSNGKVGINIAAPAYQLDVNGDARVSNLPFLANRDTILTYDPSTKQMMATKINGAPSSVKLTSDLVVYSATALTNATGLSFSVNANTYYHFKFLVVFSTAATATGIRLSISAPAAPAILSAKASIPVAADNVAGELQGWITASDDVVIGTGVQVINTNYVAIVEGTILTGAAGGTVQLRYGSEIAGSGVTIRRASFGQLTQY